MIKFAPCSFCDRKAGFFSNNKNYCWVHWHKDFSTYLNIPHYTICTKDI